MGRRSLENGGVITLWEVEGSLLVGQSNIVKVVSL